MISTHKHSTSNSKKSNSRGEHFEPLESRQLMSASLTHLATPEVAHVKPAVHVKLENSSGKALPTLSAITTPVKYIPIHLPTFFIEPKVDSNVTGWKNVSSDPLFAPGGPSANDIYQGNVGDCWFVAALASSALHDPSLIEKDITERADGTYDVYFHTSATTTIDEHVDGLLPINSSGGLEYAKLGQDNSTWVPIMEKALTYFRNRSIPACYSTISGGSGYEAFNDLAGNATEVLGKVSSASQLFTDVAWSMLLNQATDFCTKGSGGGPLVNDHCYSVVSVRVSGGVDQIEVRNPWGWNPGFVANKNGFGATNNGYLWVNASSVLPELDEFVNSSV